MSLPATEALLSGDALDSLTPRGAAQRMLEGQRAAVQAVDQAAEEIAAGAALMAGAIRAGGHLVYAAAGSSGLMALADASELSGTFGITRERIRLHMAGGVPVNGQMPGASEDDSRSASELAAQAGAADVLIVLSASGTTPYAVAFARTARSRGAKVIALANNPDTTLLSLADVAICLETPPEVLAGSTRLAAGTSQKVALNLMSTLMGIKLGHVYQGMMVNVVADNAKLVRRAKGIVSRIANVGEDIATKALQQAGGQVKAAILIASGFSPRMAERLLIEHEGHLENCFKAQSASTTTHHQTSSQGELT